MSINLKLLFGTVLLALIALGTLAHVRSSQDVAAGLTWQVFSAGVQPMAALEEVYARVSRLEARAAGANGAEVARPGSSEMVAELGAILTELGEIGGSIRPSEASHLAMADLRQAVSRLKATEGDVSDRLLRQELARISENLSQGLVLLRADLRAMQKEAGSSFVVAERGHAIGVAALLLALVLFAWLISADVSSRIRRAVSHLRAVEAGGAVPAATAPPPFRDLFDAIAELGAGLSDEREAAAREGEAAERRRAEDMAQLEKRFQATIERMQEGFCLLDEKRNLVAANAPFRRMFADFDAKTGTPGDPALDAILAARAPGIIVQETAEGRTLEVRRHAVSGRSTIILVEDVTEKRAASQTIERLAGCDPLTGLPNRARFQDHLGAALAGRNRTDEMAVFSLDIQGFQEINAAHGGTAGDFILRRSGERLASLLDEGDFLARTGADEFAIVKTSGAEAARCRLLAERIVEAFAAPIEVDGASVAAPMAIGLVHLEPRGRRTPLERHAVIRDAEMALAGAREHKRGGYRLFSPAIRLQAEERWRLEQDLGQALARNQFELHYQPFADVRRGAVSGFEALLRWNHPEQGAIPPGRFIPVAEEAGLIDEIGRWVLGQACTTAATWPARLGVSVNLSAIQLREPRIVADIAEVLTHSKLAPHRLQLEVTESVFLGDAENTLERLSALRRLGATISMDDFGTGYSSLGYLSRFPFDKLKIDQGFVRDMGKRENAAIIKAVVGLSASMGIGVIAEGVETREQFEALRREGCGEMQGFFLGRPAPASQLARHLSRIEGAFADGTLARLGAPAQLSA